MSASKPHRRRRRIPTWVFVLVSLLALAGGLFGYGLYAFANPTGELPGVVETATPRATAKPTAKASPTPTVSASAGALPATASISVPFTTQAPTVNWDATHEEACEEASLIMVKHFLAGSAFGSAADVDAEILDLISFETSNGYAVDVTVSELNDIAEKKYGLTTGRAVRGGTIDGLKRELAAGRPVILPANGKMLDNPNFRNGGPKYHMFVLTGYNAGGFVTNDPGTRNGSGYIYSYDTILNAWNDWNGDAATGGRNYLVFDK